MLLKFLLLVHSGTLALALGLFPEFSARLLIFRSKVSPVSRTRTEVLLLPSSSRSSRVPLIPRHVLVLFFGIGRCPSSLHASLELRVASSSEPLLMIILLPLVCIAQHRVRVRYHLEFLVRLLIIGVLVRVVLLGQLVVRFLDLALGSRRCHL